MSRLAQMHGLPFQENIEQKYSSNRLASETTHPTQGHPQH